MLTTQQIQTFIEQHQLPEAFTLLISEHYLHVAQILANLKRGSLPALVGINGAQGTGKSTLASFLKLALENNSQRKVAVLSLDDFYFTKQERQRLANEIHPLLATRGVPGTHDIPLLLTTIKKLQTAAAGESIQLPSFNKATDDRQDQATSHAVCGPVDLIILEGWCVGSKPQSEETLESPINNLERAEDKDQTWRVYVNNQLANAYAETFAMLDYLIFLQAPSMASIFRWRTEQENKLLQQHSAAQQNDNLGHKAEMEVFLMHYERITRENLKTLPATADLVLLLDEDHQCIKRTSLR